MKGCILRQLREQQGITQTELGKHIHLSQTTISHYETGTSDASREVEQAIADYFCVSIQYLNGESEYQALGAKLHKEYAAGISLLQILQDMLQLTEEHKASITDIIHSLADADKK